ncbi:MAG: ribosome hibernation-promoting factor, HPF/YfiA family [Gemmataceae bacterium]
MQIKISSRHGHVTKDVEEFIQEKMQKLLHIFDRLTMIEVIVDLKEDDRMVEIQAEAEHKHDFVARAHHQQIPSAVEGALHKLEAQLRKYKEKIQDRRKHPSTKDVAGAPILEEPAEE